MFYDNWVKRDILKNSKLVNENNSTYTFYSKFFKEFSLPTVAQESMLSETVIGQKC